MTDRLSTAEAAALLGVTPATFRSYVAKGYAPPADGRHDARTPWWLRSTIETWDKNRRRQRPWDSDTTDTGADDRIKIL